MESLLAILLINSGIITFFLWRLGNRLEDLAERQLTQLPGGPPIHLGHTTTTPVPEAFTATTALPVSEESIRYAEAKINEELLARGTPASAERVREHVKSLLGA